MFKKMILKTYRKIYYFEDNYSSQMTDKMLFGWLWYHVFTQLVFLFMQKFCKKSDPKYILFDTVPDFNGNAKALYEYMIGQGINRRYRIAWIVDEPEQYGEYKTGNVRFIRRRGRYTGIFTVKCQLAYLKARYVFCSKTAYFVTEKRKGQIYIGIENNFGLLREQKDYLKDNAEELKQDFLIVPDGIFAGEKKDLSKSPKGELCFRKLTGRNSNLKKILWMPQYRQPSLFMQYRTGIASVMGVPMIHSVSDLPRLNDLCRENGVHLVIYCNPDSEALSKASEGLTHVSFLTGEERRGAGVEIFELLPEFDAMVSDYAAEALDFLSLDKPVAYVLEDYEEICGADGFLVNDPMQYMPGEKIYSMDDLAEFMRHVAQGQDEYRMQRKEICGKLHQVVKEDGYKRILEQFGIC